MIVYIKDHCGFSRRVLNAIEALEVPITIKNKKDEGVIDELLQTGGKQQFPCLVCDDGQVMYESDAIVRYLCEQYGGDPEHYLGEVCQVCSID